MKLLAVFGKALREQARQPLLLALSLVFAPVFVLLYRVWFPSGSTTYPVLVWSQDRPALLADGSALSAGDDVLRALQAVVYPNGSPLLKVRPVAGREEADRLLREREAHALLILPANLSETIGAARAGQAPEASPVTIVGDLTNPYYAVAAVLAGSAVDQYVQAAVGRPAPVVLAEEPLGASAARTEFENYVPGLLVFATMMLMFSAAMTVVREAESRTLRRLQLSQVSALEFLGGSSAALVLIGIADVMLTFLVAGALGFRSQGPVWLAMLVGALTSLSIVGVGLVVASLSRTAMQAFLVANFPLGLFMFFSGAIYPVPRVPLLTIGGRTLGLYDVLPPTHAVAALNKVLTLGAGLDEVGYELAALAVLSALYFALGAWLFKRTHMRAH